MAPKETEGMPALMCACPNDPLDPLKMQTLPCRLEVELQDEDGVMKWFEIPFHIPNLSLIDTTSELMRRRKN